MQQKYEDLQKKIEYCFHDSELLITALTHSSYLHEEKLPKSKCNERFEFLGDAVLELVSSEFLINEHPEMPEGKLTRLRASMVCEPSLAMCARDIQLGSYLRMGKGEALTGGRDRDSIISDAFEALIGAIYLDGGFANAKDFIHKFVFKDLENKQLFYDSKTILQEMVQGSHMGTLTYRLLSEEGPDHNKTFQVEALIDDVVFGTGKGKTKKAAEQEAAYKTILKLREKN